jgi:hypothetical protein
LISIVRSNGGALYAFLQSISVYHDHLILRSPGKLIFVSPFTIDELSARIVSSSSGSGIDRIKDSLEVYRSLSLSNEDIATPHVLEDVSGGDAGKRRINIWMCRLFLNMTPGEDSENRSELQEVLDALCKEALVARNPNIDLERQQNQDWRCPLCAAADLVNVLHDRADCGGCGVVWPRCCLTLRVCDEPALLACRWCGAVARTDHGVAQEKASCTFCGGRLALQTSCL